MRELSVYFSGEWIPSAELRIPADDAGFLLGATVTERLRTFRGEVFRMDEHLRRLRRSLEIVGLETGSIIDQVATAIPEFLHRNHDQIEPDDDWSVIVFATPGVAGSGRPTVCVHGYPLPFKSWASLYETGLPVVISSIRQVPPDCWPPELKCRSRMHFYLADREAATRKPGARAVLLDQDGFVAEATTANVVIFREGEGLVSPPHDHILFGVSLGVVQELAAKIKVPFVTRRVTVDEFCSAGEAFITSTSICALPIIECDGKKIGDGRPGPIFRRLLAAWNELVGIDVADQARRYANRSPG
jgi:branched-subunit amino acid aminotransferase/4-amino-4-deoxychorismate lyase